MISDTDNDSNMTSPEKQDGSKDENNEMSNPNDNKDNNNSNNNMPNNMDIKVSNKKIDTIYYIILGISNTFISCLLIYLIMSKFNKKTFKEVFINTDKVLIYVFELIILTTIMTFIYVFVSNKIIIIILIMITIIYHIVLF